MRQYDNHLRQNINKGSQYFRFFIVYLLAGNNKLKNHSYEKTIDTNCFGWYQLYRYGR